MAIRLVSSEVVQWTPEFALGIRDMKAMRRERDLSPTRLRQHAKLVKAEELMTIHIGMVKCNEDGETYRSNGQHTSCSHVLFHQAGNGGLDPKSEVVWTAMRSKKCGYADLDDLPAFPENAQANVELSECDTIQDLHAAFARWDSSMSVRKGMEHLKIFAAEYPEDFDNVAIEMVHRALQGVVEAIRTDSQVFGEHVYIPLGGADNRGALLRCKEIREFVLWAMQKLGERKLLFDCHILIGAFAKVYQSEGEDCADSCFDAICNDIDNERKPAFDLWMNLNKKESRPKNDTIKMKAHRTVCKALKTVKEQ